MKTIKIFLASSEELKQERLELADLVEHLNHTLGKLDMHIQLVKWEYLDSSMGPTHKQEEYNRELCTCDLCIVIYWTKFGMYTKTELDTAYNELCAGRNPKKLYVYFKDGAEVTPDLQAFRDSFPSQYGHFFCKFENIDTLKSQFLLQFLDYQSKHLGNSNIIEVRDSQVIVDGKTYVDLKNVPFAGNNDEYNDLLEEIEELEEDLEDMTVDSPRYARKAEKLLKLKEKRAQLENSLWDTALMITRLSTTKCSERLQRAMDLFSKGDNRGAQAVLNEEEIERDVQHNLNLIRLGEEGRKGLAINIEEYKLKIKTLKNDMADGWRDAIVELHHRILDLSEKLYGECSLEHADHLNDAVLTYSLLRLDNEMLQTSLRTLEIRKLLLGEEHPATATSYNNVGSAYGYLGEYEKSLEFYLKSLEISKLLLGDEHPKIASSYNNVGGAYGYLGEYQKSLEFLLKSLELRKSLLGEEHPATATSYNNVGGAYGDLGEYQKSLEFYLKSLELNKLLLGDEHPDTATSYNNVGYTYVNLGEYQKALEYFPKAIQTGCLSFIEEARTYKTIGIAYRNIGNYTQALTYAQKSLELSIQAFGEENIEVAYCYGSVALALRLQEKYEEALHYFENSLRISERLLPPPHEAIETFKQYIQETIKMRDETL